MAKFIGNIEAKVDAKGRVFLPAQFRKSLQQSGEDTLAMRKDVYERCLVLYPESSWDSQMEELRSRLNRWDAAQQMVFRQFVSDVEMVSIDGSGRLLIPKRCIQLAGIGQQVRFVGMGDTIEIWNADGECVDTPFMDPGEFGKALQGVMRS